MKAICMILVSMVVVGCASKTSVVLPPAKTVTAKPVSECTRDCEVIETALLALTEDKEFKGYLRREDFKRVVLDRQVSNRYPWSGALDYKEIDYGVSSAIENFNRRNQPAPETTKKESLALSYLDEYEFNQRILLSELGDTSVIPLFYKQFPDAIGFASAPLPGYSQDSKTAVVNFSVGPSAHGAEATVVLKQERGVWHSTVVNVSFLL